MILKEYTPEKYLICRELGGVLMRDGNPLVNYKITRKLSWNENEEGITDSFLTDQSGHFRIPEHYETMKLSFLSQFVGKTDLIANIDGKDIHFWVETHLRAQPQPLDGTMDMVCDNLNERQRVSTDGMLGTLCTWEGMSKEVDPDAL